MLKYLIENKNPLFWVIFHILLGMASTLSPIFIIGYFYFFVATSVTYVLRFKNVNSYISVFLIYLIAFEILARMAKTSPYLPYETGKYMMFFGLLYGILAESRRGVLGYFMLLALLPAFFFDLSGEVIFKDLIFNLIGPINLCLAVIYFYRNKFTLEGLKVLMRFMIYPILSVLGFIFIKTPDLSEIDFTLGANFSTTGGFGSNQVSTVLGLAMYLIFLFWINRWKFSGYRMVDLAIICVFAFQGLLSFSRGGVIGGALGILIFILVIRFAGMTGTRYKLPQVGRYLIFGVIALIVSFMVANLVTGGMLLLRYQGETAGTLSGIKEKNLNALTTGRLEIFMEDFELFERYTVAGVGAGGSKYMRSASKGILTHVELGRLLSEHGLFGIFNFLLTIIVGFTLFYINKNPVHKGILIGFYVIGLYSMFHAATRTFVSPVLIGLSVIWIVELKKKPKKKVKPQITE